MSDASSTIYAVIPAFNEQDSVGAVVHDIPKDLVNEIIVVDNGSTDLTAQRAARAGATVLHEPRKGYGAACLKGLTYIGEKPPQEHPEIVVFLDGDYADFPEQMSLLIHPILEGEADFVVGSRATGNRQKGSMTLPQVIGNRVATTFMRWIYGVKFTDLGPFRAIRYTTLLELNMVDTNYGWTVEMQIKAAKKKVRSTEVPVDYRQRIGVSKVSGTFKGAIFAGYKILKLIVKYA